MTPFTLLQAFGGVDAALVERAARPHRKAHLLRWVAAVAAAAVAVTALGVWWLGGDTPDDPGVVPSVSDPSPSTTVPNDGDGTGGDERSCPLHGLDYHTIGLGGLGDAYNEDEMVEAFLATLPESGDPDRTYPYGCHYPHSNIVDFVRFCGITRDQYIDIMGWGDVLDEVYTVIPSFVGEPSRYLYTFGELADATCGDDPHLAAWVFEWRASYLYEYGEEGMYQYYYFVHYDPWYPDPLVDYVKQRDGWTEEDGRFDYEGTVMEFVEDFNITREEFIAAYGWQDKLDQNATDHFTYAPYTYRQYVEAIYGDDTALQDWVFDCYVFRPGYPAAP